MTTKKALPQIVNDIYILIEPLESEERQKVIGSVMTLLGESSKPSQGSNNVGDAPPASTNSLGPKANRWMNQNGISTAMIEEIFHCEGDEAQVIASDVPGNGKKGKTSNCYLLAGTQALLATDEPKFADSVAMELCKHMGCHDAKNHASNRSELGNIVAGTKNSGFTLPAPGLRAAADLIKAMSKAG